MKARIKGIETYKLILDTRYHIDMKSCLYVARRTRNLLSIVKLDKLNFNFRIGNYVFSLFKDYGSCTLVDALYRFNLDINFKESLFNIEQLLVVSEVHIKKILLICGIKC